MLIISNSTGVSLPRPHWRRRRLYFLDIPVGITFGSVVGVLGLGCALMTIYVARSTKRVRELVSWATYSAPGSVIYVIEPTRGLRRIASATSNIDPRFWAMALGGESAQMWSEAGEPPAIVLARVDLRGAVADVVDFSRHKGFGLRVWLRDSTTPIDFGLYGMPGRVSFTKLSNEQMLAIADALVGRTR